MFKVVDPNGPILAGEDSDEGRVEEETVEELQNTHQSSLVDKLERVDNKKDDEIERLKIKLGEQEEMLRKMREEKDRKIVSTKTSARAM